MQVKVETTKGLERQLTITVPYNLIEAETETVIIKKGEKEKIPGFRPGKTPLHILKKHFGESAKYPAMNKVVDNAIKEALTQEKLMPAGQPKVEIITFEPAKPVEFKVTFEIYPEIKLAEFKDIELEQIKSEVTDSDLQKTIENLRKQNTEWTQVERAAKNDDQVIIDFEGFIDDKPFDGNSAQKTKLVLGSKSMIPGFEDKIIGFKPGEEKEITVTFPKDYFHKEFANKDAVFKINVHEVHEPTLPEVNEEFIKKLGVKSGTVDEFKKELRASMERELNNAIESKNKMAVLNKLLEINDIEVPSALVDQETDFLHSQAMQRYSYYAQDKKTPEIPKELFKNEATRRVKLGLLLADVIKTNEITPDPEKVKALIGKMVNDPKDYDKTIKWLTEDQQRLAQLQQVALEEQVVEKLLEFAKVIEKSVDFEEAMKPAGNEGNM